MRIRTLRMRLLFLIVRVLFVVVAIWGVFGFGGQSLFDIAEHKFGFSSRGAAAFLSAIVGLLGAVSFIPAKGGLLPDNQDEKKAGTP